MSKVNKVLTIPNKVNSARDIVNLGKEARKWYREHYQFQVAVSSDDSLYTYALAWLTEESIKSTKPPRSLLAGHQVNNKIWYTSVQYFVDQEKDRIVNISDHRIRVSLYDPAKEDSETPNGISEMKAKFAQPKKIIFYSRTRSGQKAVQEFLQTICRKSVHVPGLHILSRYDNWTRRDDLPARSLESVVLKRGQAERMRADLVDFLASEDDYNSLGMPWHRGYFLYGPPGTGKTSVVRALATSLGLDLYFVSINDLESDTRLLDLVADIKPKSILLLEDIDRFDISHDSESSGSDSSFARRASIGGLLNSLDGVATPHGMITFMTANNKDVLDDALVRPGRIGLTEEIGLPDQYQVNRMFSNFYQENVEVPIIAGKPSSYYTEIFQRNIRKPKSALQELRDAVC